MTLRSREGDPDAEEIRSDYARDVDRLLYTSALRRLSGVTQVVSHTDAYVHHDRLTHSLKVASVSQAIAKSLGGPISVDVVHAAALAHDIGHPPFGHAAEAELMAILDGRIDREGAALSSAQASPILADSFEGNAQSLRIVARLSARKYEERDAGLNLTFRTLAAILKYPWLRGQEPHQYRALHDIKWGAYESEGAELTAALAAAVDSGVMGTYRSVEADIMDWADDVSYAVHDTEDFFRAGLIPLDVLRANDAIWREFHDYAKRSIQNRRVKDWQFDESVFDSLLEAIRDVLPKRPYVGDFDSREELHLFGSDSIRALLRDIRRDNRGDLEISIEQRTRVEILKKLTRFYVIDSPDVLFAQRGQRRMIRQLFWALYDEAVEARSTTPVDKTLPRRFDDYCSLALRSSAIDGYGDDTRRRIARATVDFICSLTDGQAANMWRQLYGYQDAASSRVFSL